MKPISFPEQNSIAAENQPPYQPLPMHRSKTENGEVVSCWALSWRERLTLLLTGKIWLQLLCFSDPVTPSYLTVKKSEVVPAPLKLNHEAVIKSVDAAKKARPDVKEWFVIIHDELYDSKGVDINESEKIIGCIIFPLSTAKEYISIPEPFTVDNLFVAPDWDAVDTQKK